MTQYHQHIAELEYRVPRRVHAVAMVLIAYGKDQRFMATSTHERAERRADCGGLLGEEHLGDANAVGLVMEHFIEKLSE